MIDDIMVGVIMLDDEFDWAEDLQAGRYNTFVAYCSEMPQHRGNLAANRLAVLREIYLGRRAQPFFEVIRGRLRTALRTAEAIGFRGLVDFIAWFDHEVKTCGAWLHRSRQQHEGRERLRQRMWIDRLLVRLSVEKREFMCLRQRQELGTAVDETWIERDEVRAVATGSRSSTAAGRAAAV
ncbi:MAG TPA: hypothetical protein VF014_06530 [Casimicrobiaceae bacterium]|nr:hypothetical protein [Casimicrobiaceae bacterium]